METGDLGFNGKYSVEHETEWQTDSFGLRNRPEAAKDNYEVVVVGDSSFAGSALSQKDTIAEALERELDRTVYSFAPRTMAGFLANDRFVDNPPKIVVVSRSERWITPASLKPIDWKAPNSGIEMQARAWFGRNTSRDFQNWFDFSAKKSYLLVFETRNSLGMNKPKIVDEKTGMLFYGVSSAINEPSHEERIKHAVDVVREYKAAAERRGMRFVFVPIPDKETVYFDLIPETHMNLDTQPDFMSELVESLNEAGIEAIDLLSVYNEERSRSGELLYHMDDTHWNSHGVEVAARAIAKAVER